uniref:ROK family protein n=1 Tax=Peterkaempfera griseoplana TaxID=66896 RepID=UPI0006E39F4A
APGPPRAGRPQVPVAVDNAHHLACGIHIAVSRITFSLVDLRGRVVAEERIPRVGGPARVLAHIRRDLPRFLSRRTRGRSVLGIGVVTGGRVDPDLGVVAENTPLGWGDVPVRAALSSAVHQPVHVDSHARALARAELLLGSGAGRSELVHLFAGNVVDAAIATSGTVLRGRHSGAGDIAHLPVPGSTVPCPCGRTGCLQAAVSEQAVAARAHQAGLVPAPEFRLLLDAASAGSPAALRVLRGRLRQVAHAAAVLLDVIGPEVMVVTDRSIIRLPELIPELHQGIADLSHLCRDPERIVVPTSFGTRVLAVAAGSVVLDAVYRRPMELRTAPAHRTG